MPSLGEELKQQSFRSDGHKVLLSVLRTADLIKLWLLGELKEKGFTLGHYNVLRILRGSPGGLPTLEIMERMIEYSPGITRLLDRLEKEQMVRRTRPDTDRRLVICEITNEGISYLNYLDPRIDAVHEKCVAKMTDEESYILIDLLERIRDQATPEVPMMH